MIEGVSQALNDKMEAVGATVCGEDGTLGRVCEHGISHPVAHIHGRNHTEQQIRNRHSEIPSRGLVRWCECDGCCAEWPKSID
jgi:hypothetical protein